MDLAGYVVNAVLVEGRSVTEVCEAHDISRSWLYELIARYRRLGEEGLEPRSRRPRSSPTRLPAGIEDEIVALRKELTDLGVDAGAHTIRYHLQVRHRRRKRAVPSVATIWRVLSRRGFIVPQPQAGRHHPLDPDRRHRRGDSQHHRRPTPGCWSLPAPWPPPWPPMWSKPSTTAPPSWGYRPRC